MEVVLRVIEGPHEGKEFVFDQHDTFIVGRWSQAHFSVPEDGFLSREHFLVEFNPPLCFLRDLGSTNGTKVNGVRVDTARLNDGDVIAAGKSTFSVHVDRTWSEIPRVKCLGCHLDAPDDIVLAARPGEGTVEWLCETCILHRRRYPTPPRGYWIEQRIGGGGMGEVYRARHIVTNRTVALKMMMPTVAASDRAKDYFRREMEVLKNLRHPNIVEFYDVDEDDGQFHLLMEYVPGRNAREWVETLPNRQLSVSVAARLGAQLLSALDHAHEKGYVHRDIKPSNLLITGSTARPDLKLSDFGLAKSFRDNAGFTGLTHQGDIGGSIGFLSPDHIRDFRQVKEPADIYSAGATLYYLLTGKYPFLDFDPNKTNAYAMILEHPSVPLRVHRPDAPELLERVLRKALEKQPAQRWRSAAAMAAVLRPLLEEEV